MQTGRETSGRLFAQVNPYMVVWYMVVQEGMRLHGTPLVHLSHSQLLHCWPSIAIDQSARVHCLLLCEDNAGQSWGKCLVSCNALQYHLLHRRPDNAALTDLLVCWEWPPLL